MQPSDISVSCPACGDAGSEIGGRLRLLRTLCISALLTMPLFWNLHPLIQLAIASVLQFWPGAYFYKGAYKTLRQGVLGMDFLVAVSTTVIYLHSACIALTVHHDVKLYFLSEGVLLSLILFGKYMECTSRYEASEAIRKLIRLQPETANVLRGGTVQAVEIHALTPGDIVQVRSGERVPIDGAEQLRPGAAEAVRALRDRGMELWMISGDKREKAERIAGMLGIENVLCEVRPADKSDAVKALQARGKHVCFIGDGINDSPALACADIGVALGCGADIAISTADVMIVSSSMQSVQTVFDISAATMKNVRQNLIWAAVYNVICIPLAASGIINPSIAAAAMALSSNGVLLNALRLKKYEPRTI